MVKSSFIIFATLFLFSCQKEAEKEFVYIKSGPEPEIQKKEMNTDKGREEFEQKLLELEDLKISLQNEKNKLKENQIDLKKKQDEWELERKKDLEDLELKKKNFTDLYAKSMNEIENKKTSFLDEKIKAEKEQEEERIRLLTLKEDIEAKIKLLDDSREKEFLIEELKNIKQQLELSKEKTQKIVSEYQTKLDQINKQYILEKKNHDIELNLLKEEKSSITKLLSEENERLKKQNLLFSDELKELNRIASNIEKEEELRKKERELFEAAKKDNDTENIRLIKMREDLIEKWNQMELDRQDLSLKHQEIKKMRERLDEERKEWIKRAVNEQKEMKEKYDSLFSDLEKEKEDFFNKRKAWEEEAYRLKKEAYAKLEEEYKKLESERKKLDEEKKAWEEEKKLRNTIISDVSDDRERILDERLLTRTEFLDSSKIEDDPLFKYQWHLNNIGQDTFSRSKGLAGEDINAMEAYKKSYTGKGIKIAVSDTGVEIRHEDINPNIISGSRNYNLTNKEDDYTGDPTPRGREPKGHGTSVAGIIGARGWNGKGGRGVAPLSSIVGFNFLGEPRFTHQYVHQIGGDFDIFNFSYGKSPCNFNSMSKSYVEKFKEAVKNLRNGKGALYVKSAGNEFKESVKECNKQLSHNYYGNSAIIEENSIPYVIVTGAISAKGIKASYSSPGSNIWISAPGGEYGTKSPAILTTDLSGCENGYSKMDNYPKNKFEYGHSQNYYCNYTSTMNGTSSAAPVVSGVLALILEANPILTWRDVKHILASTARKVDDTGQREHPEYTSPPRHIYQEGWIKNSAGYSFNNWYGFGAINASKAVAMAEVYKNDLGELIETENPNDRKWYYNSGYLNSLIPDYSAQGVSSRINVKHDLIIEAIQVKLNISHTSVSDLGVELYSPSGTKSILLNINSGIIDRDIKDGIILTNAFYGESSLGDWTLKVIDGGQAQSGRLENWSIKAFGHVSKGETATYSINPMTIKMLYPSSNEIQATWNSEKDENFLRYEVSLGSKPGSSNMMKWFSVGENESVNIDINKINYDLYTKTKYYFNIRAVNKKENASQSQSSSWSLK